MTKLGMILLTAVIFIISCGEPCHWATYPVLGHRKSDGYYEKHFYKFNTTYWMSNGIQVDTNHPETFNRLEAAVTSAVECTKRVAPTLPKQELEAAFCNYHVAANPRCDEAECLRVKITDKWSHWSKDGKYQLLRDWVECDPNDKGFTGDCYWRSGLQDDNIIVAAPQACSDIDYGDEACAEVQRWVIVAVSGCLNPYTPSWQQCFDFSTDPTRGCGGGWQ
jgi:hypothetical protein